MTMLLLLAVLGADEGKVAPAEATPPVAVAAETPKVELPQRTTGEVRTELSRLLAAERSAETIATRQAIILEMTKLYCEVAADPRLPDNETLDKHRVKLRARLIDLRDEFKRRVAHQKKTTRDETPGTQKSETTAQATSGAAGGANVADNASQLIAVIESTIAPESWESRGGPGVIRYYAAVHALVVRATADVHGELGGLVDALREVGR